MPLYGGVPFLPHAGRVEQWAWRLSEAKLYPMWLRRKAVSVASTRMSARYTLASERRVRFVQHQREVERVLLKEHV